MDFVTTVEAAKRLKVSRQRVIQMIDKGLIPACRPTPTGTWKIPESYFARLEEQANGNIKQPASGQ